MVVATVSHQLDSPPRQLLGHGKALPAAPEVDSFTAHLESRAFRGVLATAATKPQPPLPPPPSKVKLFGARSNSSKEKLEGIGMGIGGPAAPAAPSSLLLPARIPPRGTGSSLSVGVVPAAGPPAKTHHSGGAGAASSSTSWLRQPHPNPPLAAQSVPTTDAPCPASSPPASVTCRSPSPPRLDSVETGVGLGNAGGGPTLSRKKSSASLLYRSVGRGLGRAASVMRRNNTAPDALPTAPAASTSTNTPPRSTEPGGSRHPANGTWSSRRARRNPSVGLAELSEDVPVPVIADKVSESPPKEASSRMKRSGTLSRRRKSSHMVPPTVPADAGVSRPFNVQHELHVTADLDGLPQEWLQSLKIQGLSEQDLLLITAAQRRQRAVALTPIRPVTPGSTRALTPTPAAASDAMPVVTVTASRSQVSFPDEPPRPVSQRTSTSPSTPTEGESSGASRRESAPTRSDSRRTRRHTFIDGTSLQRSSSIISKLLSDLDSISTRPSRPVTVVTDTLSPPIPGRPISGLTIGHDASARSSIAESLHALTRRLSDDLAGFRNIDIASGEENWAASILAAWDVDKALQLSPVPEQARTSLSVPPAIHVLDYVLQPSLSVEHEAEETESVSAAVHAGTTPSPSPLPTPLLVGVAPVPVAPMARLYPEDSGTSSDSAADAADDSEPAGTGTDTGYETTDDHQSDEDDNEPVHLRRRSRSFDWTVINRASTFTPLPPPPPRHVIRSPTPQASLSGPVERPREITGLRIKRRSVDSFGVLPSASAYSEQSRRSLDDSPGTPSSELAPESASLHDAEPRDADPTPASSTQSHTPSVALAFRPGHPFVSRSRSNTFDTQDSLHSTLSSEYFKRYPLQAQRIQPQPAAGRSAQSFPLSGSSSDHNSSFPVSAVSVPVSPTVESSHASHPFFTPWNPTGFGASSLPQMSALGLCLDPSPEPADPPAPARTSAFSTSSATSAHEATLQRAWPLRRVNESLEHCRNESESGSSNDAISALGALEEAAWRMSISQGR